MEKKTKACPFCWEEILEEAKKCKHCGEFLEETPKKKKRKMSTLEWIFIIVVTIAFIWLCSHKEVDKSNVRVNEVKQVKHYSNLNEAYNDHKSFLWQVCREWLKIISTNQAHDFEWPTYAWEYQGKFIMKWTDHWVLFRCEFVPYENEWGMNLEDVKRDI